MMTQTHILVAAALFARPGAYARNTAAIAGSLMPDFALYALFAWHRWLGDSANHIFNTLYWSDSWQRLMAPGNSFFVYGGLAAISASLINPERRWGKAADLVLVFSLAALLHVATDFPLHVDDAHRHLWPVTDWKFVSPVSYWDDRYHAQWVQPIETLLAIGCLIVLLRRFSGIWVRFILAVALSAYILVPLSYRLGAV